VRKNKNRILNGSEPNIEGEMVANLVRILEMKLSDFS
jgi:hypothetical protein